ncbi:MAG: hypothetical protein ACI9DF_005020 [Verrucomicrobiales bacterium]|jgi:hypothetical protein
MILRISFPILLLMFAFGMGGRAEEATTVAAVRFDPVVQEMEGWTVHVDPALLSGEHAAGGKKALRMLGDHLNRISLLVEVTRLKNLQRCEIWIEHDHPTLKSMQYHPSMGWLKANRHDLRLTRKVHITRAAALLERGQLLKHPAVVLHELAHAYHDQFLTFEHEPTVKAYEKAMEAGLYDKVLLFNGQMVPHYAKTNHKEYFAESTESYFYRNDFYPFVRAELKEHDPGMHTVMETVWGKLE